VKVEGFHFDSRKHLVEYDDVLNKQREIVYRKRRKILEGESQKEEILGNIAKEIGNVVALYADEKGTSVERGKIVAEFVSIIPFDPASQQQLLAQLEQLHTAQDITEFLTKISADMYETREKQISPELMRQIERWVCLQVIDSFWMEHLDAVDDLREGIGLRGYGQLDPLVEYKNEAFNMFDRLMAGIDGEIVHRIYKVQVATRPPSQSSGVSGQANPTNNNLESPITKAAKNIRTNVSEQAVAQPVVNVGKKLGRNDPCPCGSGLKYKKCGLINAPEHRK
jgi:preprotein translocase subunit SecA